MQNDYLSHNRLLEQSCRVAFNALLQDLRIFADRAGKVSDLELLEGFFPKKIRMEQESDPFVLPIIEKAASMALGLEGLDSEQYAPANKAANPDATLQSTLFEQINRFDKNAQFFQYHYPLAPLSPTSIFPVKSGSRKEKGIGRQDYEKLWQDFRKALESIPQAYRSECSLWLDHFETAWGVYSHSIPKINDASLYDHSKAMAAFSVALWRFHQEQGGDDVAKLNDRQSWRENKFLLIQGDFFGVQKIVFADGDATNRYAEKLLRGRSFYVSLLSECAALRVLDALALPSTSQVIDAADKFMIVAPNTKGVVQALQRLQQELDTWFLEYFYGQAGVSLTWTEACGHDFCSSVDSSEEDLTPYQRFYQKMSVKQEVGQYQRFNLCEKTASSVVLNQFLNALDQDKGVCQMDGHSPASERLDQEIYVSKIALDQLKVGECSTRYEHLLITRNYLNSSSTLSVPLFGYHISFVDAECWLEEFSEQCGNDNVLRIWEFSLPKSADQSLWNGCARRYLNTYAPIVGTDDLLESGEEKYACGEKSVQLGALKPFSYLASNDRIRSANGWQGVSALSSIRGDIDNVGVVFEKGLGNGLNFTKTIALSRQVKVFFDVYLAWLCRSKYKNTYMVFAGGDDFLMLGPWLSQIQLIGEINRAFRYYVAGNEALGFSAGISTAKSDLPTVQLCKRAEQSLKQAKTYKSYQGDTQTIALKNAVSCFNQSMNWQQFVELTDVRYRQLQALSCKNNINIGYVYSLLELIEMAETVSEKPENAIWHSYFSYRTTKMLERLKLDKTEHNKRQAELANEIVGEGINVYGAKYKVSLFCHLYSQRN